MDDLIKRDDALALCDRYPYVEGVKSALEDLPAIDPAAIREAALREAAERLIEVGYPNTDDDAEGPVADILAMIGEKK